jgi:replication-associated recombination protein RarA
VRVTLDAVAEATRTRGIVYDKDADAHYDVVSAFIKSMRGSDPDAAVYWLARMLEGGEAVALGLGASDLVDTFAAVRDAGSRAPCAALPWSALRDALEQG